MVFKKNASIETDDFWYDLFEGGYIKPSKLLENKEEVKRVNEAIKTLKEFCKAAEDQEIIQYM